MREGGFSLKINPTYHEAWDFTEAADRPAWYAEYRRKWTEYPADYHVGNFPINLDLELTNQCNLRCTMCMRNWLRDMQEGMMTRELYRRCIDEAVQYDDFYAVKLNYRGESTLHCIDGQTDQLDIGWFIEYAKDAGVREVSLNTNGNFPRSLVPDLLQLDNIGFSLDAYSPAVYQRIRRGGSLRQSRENLLMLMKLRGQRKKPVIRVSMVKLQLNEADRQRWVSYWRDEVGVDQGSMNDWFNPQGKDHRQLGRRLLQDPGFICAQLWQRMVVLYDGTIVACCGDFMERQPLGKAGVDKLADVWTGGQLNSLRKLHQQGLYKSIRMCKDCGLTYHQEVD